MIIGEGRALELRFDSRHRQLDAESWFATLRLQEFDENDNEIDEGSLLASAIRLRVNLQHEHWFDSLDAESGDLVRRRALVRRSRCVSDVDMAADPSRVHINGTVLVKTYIRAH
jgi:hypothetical protein